MLDEGNILDLERRRLTLIGDITPDMLRTVCLALDALEKASDKAPITIIFSSDGGDAYVSFGLYDRIKASPCKVTFEVFGEVMSGGSIILQAAAKRFLYPSTTFMIHYGTTSINADDSAASAISKVNFEKNVDAQRMEDIYLSRAGKRLTRKKLREFLLVDSFFSAERAVELGLADKIIWDGGKCK